jgi:hypothetical protein
MKQRRRPERFEDRLFSALGRGLLSLIGLPFKKSKSSDLSVRWAEVQTLMAGQEPGSWVAAILKADTILDTCLKEKVPGETLGERLKNAGQLMRPDAYQAAWDGHKVRNSLAHEHRDISRFEADRAIQDFRTALNNLGAL